jgi:death-on-curing protein
MIWLTKEQVIYLHEQLIRETGGTRGIRDINALESALVAPFQTFNGVELFPTLTEKIARFAYGITEFHPFVDGNKRVGAHTLLVLLALNGIQMEYMQKELSTIFLQVADNTATCEQLHQWITSHILRKPD